MLRLEFELGLGFRLEVILGLGLVLFSKLELTFLEKFLISRDPLDQENCSKNDVDFSH